MPDYRRLVSYIYNYEDGKKRNNVGYARIEARNGLCKCTLHITAPSLNDKQLKVYFFRRENGGLDGIQIGTMAIRNGSGDLKVQTDPEHIMNSPYSIEHMGGMVLYLSDSKFFATEWDDQPINMEVVSTLEKSKETVKAVKEEEESVKTDKDSYLVAANIKTKTEFLEVMKENETESIEEKENNEFLEVKKELETESLEEKKEVETESLEEKEEVETESIGEKKEVETESIEEKKEAKLDTIEVKNAKKSELDTVDIENIKELEKVEINEEQVDSNKAVVADNVVELDTNIRKATPVTLSEMDLVPGRDLERDKWEDEMTRKYYEGERQQNNIPNGRERERQERRDKLTKPFFEDHPTAQYMYNNFESIYPFEDNEIAWCVKIEPQDIGLLPMETWALGNNSYLLHGYYGYRHLIFARLNDDKEARYILGVPGIYHNRERFMARMFGFENFKSIKKKDRRTGEFGYWYVPIVLN